MPENTTGNNVKNDEIDLLDLFHRMGRTISNWIKASGRAFLICTVFLLKRWLPLGLSVIAGVGLSYLLRTTSTSCYTSDMTLRVNAFSNSELITYINKLHEFCKDGNKIALTDALSLKTVSIDNINDISAFWIIDKGKDNIPDYIDYKNNHNLYDTINIRMKDFIDIRVNIKSIQELSLVRDAIIEFIKKDSLFQQRTRVHLRQNLEFLKRFNYDIIQLDSLQKVKYFIETKNNVPQEGGQMIFLQEHKTQMVYPDIYELYGKKQAIEAELYLYKDIVTVVSDFSVPLKRNNGALYYGKKIIPLFFFFTLFILIILANRKKLEEVYKKY